jgi:RHH-type proline utilization regulon transcriptional repressor/proline dehydrogenase/delta 1-pyrroline-5-carboxylate dehydrogenase
VGASEAAGVARPFEAFAAELRPQSALRERITAACRRPEPECLPPLLAAARLPPAAAAGAQARARKLVIALRRKKATSGGVEGLIQEYSLSSQEGIALMCLAEALLRIPDTPTRDALIRDKISTADWQAHIGNSPSLFVNAATWGLLVTGKLTATSSETSLSAALTRLIGRGGEPLIRRGVDLGLRLMGEKFVCGQTIEEALANSRKLEAKGFRHSFDMLGEAATTAADAHRYFEAYLHAIHAIGRSAGGRGVLAGPGISVKLSALHPRYSRAQLARVMNELLPRLQELALLARHYDIGLNIDAEEAERLEISLDLLEALCLDPRLQSWNGIGFVLQAYQKRCHSAIDWVIDLARRSGHRLMVRLVKGAYWDSEIKRAQVDGYADFPVFTRKLYTDVSFLACARKLLDAPDAVFPQFATHNAHTLAAVMSMGGEEFHAGQYEFQCLHGMGEPLYEQVVGPRKLNRPCRIYAPVGTHETLLAYLVRRLLENGANSSFVHRILDPQVAIAELIADPVQVASAMVPVGAPHPQILLPRALFGAERANSRGLDLSDEQQLARLSESLLPGAPVLPRAQAVLGAAPGAPATAARGTAREVRNPADRRDLVGTVIDADLGDVSAACASAAAAAPGWAATPPAARAAALWRAADLLEERGPKLLGLIVRESGKSLPNAVSEVREAIDFLRYYGAQAHARFRPGNHRPLGPVVCISPWNFPLAIFTGQLAAALVAGNPVLAKPAEETPLIAASAVQLLLEAGIPAGVLQFLPGAGEIGAALVADAATRGVMFTGSTEVARLIQRQLAGRLGPEGRPIPFIAETGGQNAMIVDSSALPEQVVGDVITSAFDSAGQRCSALRILCLQDDIAERVLAMLKGAMRELEVGNPDRLHTDIGPVITAEARAVISAHIEAMRAQGHAIEQSALPPAAAHGSFVAPALIEISSPAELRREVFGPVLHVLRYRRSELDALIDAINQTGYGLTFGLHTRIDETIARVTQRIAAGNIYVNRNIIGAVVGVQPFGGTGLSGTGPKAGGPWYLDRLLTRVPDEPDAPQPGDIEPVPPATAVAYCRYLESRGQESAARRVAHYLRRTRLGAARELRGPVGERNLLGVRPRGAILALAHTSFGALAQIGAILATGNTALIVTDNPAAAELAALPRDLRAQLQPCPDWRQATAIAGVLFEGDATALQATVRQLASLDGPVLQIQSATVSGLATGAEDYSLQALLEEVSVSTNTAAAGGNAQLMTLG